MVSDISYICFEKRNYVYIKLFLYHDDETARTTKYWSDLQSEMVSFSIKLIATIRDITSPNSALFSFQLYLMYFIGHLLYSS